MATKAVLYVVALVLIAVIVSGGYVGYIALNPTPSASTVPSPSTTPPPASNEMDFTPVQIRDVIINYIRDNHPETSSRIGRIYRWTTPPPIPCNPVHFMSMTNPDSFWSWEVDLYNNGTNSYSIDVVYHHTYDPSRPSISWSGTWISGNITQTTYQNGLK